MYEIDFLKYTIEQRDREILYLLNCVERRTEELSKIKNKINDNNQFILIDVFKLSNSIHSYNKKLDYVNVVETIGNYVRLFDCCDCSNNIDVVQTADLSNETQNTERVLFLTETQPIDYYLNILKQQVFNNTDNVLCNVKRLASSLRDYNGELDYSDLIAIINDHQIRTDPP